MPMENKILLSDCAVITNKIISLFVDEGIRLMIYLEKHYIWGNTAAETDVSTCISYKAVLVYLFL